VVGDRGSGDNCLAFEASESVKEIGRETERKRGEGGGARGEGTVRRLLVYLTLPAQTCAHTHITHKHTHTHTHTHLGTRGSAGTVLMGEDTCVSYEEEDTWVRQGQS